MSLQSKTKENVLREKIRRLQDEIKAWSSFMEREGHMHEVSKLEVEVRRLEEEYKRKKHAIENHPELDALLEEEDELKDQIRKLKLRA